MYLKLLDEYEKEYAAEIEKQGTRTLKKLHAALYHFALWLEKRADPQALPSGGTCRVCGKPASAHVRYGHKYQGIPVRR